MNWNSIPNEDRLILWKKLRIDIQNLSLEKQLEAIAKFCSTIPFGSRSLDYFNPSDWQHRGRFYSMALFVPVLSAY